MVSQSFTCKCGQKYGWIAEGEITKPCPKCHRIYKGVHNKKTLGIDAVEPDEYTCTIKITFDGNNLKAFSKEEYIEKLIETFAEEFNIDLDDSEIHKIRKIK